MDEILTGDLKKQFEALPAEVQKSITDVDLSTKLQEIVKNNKLMIDQDGGLEIETVLVLFGLEPLENYVGNLVKNVGLSNIQASVVAHDVNESIFKNVRDSLKKINEEVQKEESENNPTKEDVLSGIENPGNIKGNEDSISLSSLKSNSVNPETHESIDKGVEIKINNLPEIAPKAVLPALPILNFKKSEPFHENISPVPNIVESKLNSTVAVPKKTVIIEEKIKLPEKQKFGGDPYREPIM